MIELIVTLGGACYLLYLWAPAIWRELMAGHYFNAGATVAILAFIIAWLLRRLNI